MNKKLFRIIFLDDERRPVTIHAGSMEPASILGFVEAESLVFPDPSDIILTPDDDKVRNMFKDVKKVFLPLSQVLRIDEISMDKKAPVISIINSDKQTEK